MSARRKIFAPDGTVGVTCRSTPYVLCRVADATPNRWWDDILTVPARPRRVVVLKGSASIGVVRTEANRLRNRGVFDTFVYDLVEGKVL